MSAVDILRQLLGQRTGKTNPKGAMPEIPPQTRTLGGTEPVPLDSTGSPMATRPRVVPNATGNVPVDPVQAYPAQGFDGAFPTPQPTTSPMAVDPLRQRMEVINNKDYSRTVNPQTGEVTIGKDRDRKWSLGEKIGSFFQGMFNGDGAITAAMDRNYQEKLADKRELGQIMPAIQRQQAVQRGDLANQEQTLQNDYLAVKPELEQQKIDNTVESKQRDYDLKVRTQNWKEADKVEYYRLEREKLEAQKENRADLYDLAVRRQQEIERNNKVNNDLRERQVKVQESRAQQAATKARQSSGGTAGKPRAGRLTDAQIFKIASGIDSDFNSGKIDEATYNARINLMLEGINGRTR